MSFGDIAYKDIKTCMTLVIKTDEKKSMKYHQDKRVSFTLINTF